MIHFIWASLLLGGIGYAAVTGRMEIVTLSMMQAAEEAVVLSFHLIGIMCLWLGLMNLAKQAGLVKVVAFLLAPMMRRIFPGVPDGHPAMGAMVMSISANLLGLGNAATPLGIQAMRELQLLNRKKDSATPDMCTFMAICTTGFTLVPSTAIALRSAAGSQNPAEILGVTLLVSFCSLSVALFVDRICRFFDRRRA